jgi:nucleoside-diphosphate-sugar epimerase
VRFLIAGALGEVGSTVSSALASLGHEVVPVSSREGVGALGTKEAVAEIAQGGVEVVLSAAGRGDRRATDRTGQESTSPLAAAAERHGLPAVLLSTTRVLEGLPGDFAEDAAPACSTPYAQANADNEALWLQSAPAMGAIVRITNYFCEPRLRDSPQSLLLPWSLVTEAVATGAVVVRSSATTSREFVSADDVARAVLAVVENAPPARACATAPGLTVSLADLMDCASEALECSGLGRPAVTFGDGLSPAATCRPGWLHEHGWSSALTLGEMTRAITSWLARVDLD